MKIISIITCLFIISSISFAAQTVHLPIRDGDAHSSSGNSGVSRSLSIEAGSQKAWVEHGLGNVVVTKAVSARLVAFLKGISSAGTLTVYAVKNGLGGFENGIIYDSLDISGLNSVGSLDIPGNSVIESQLIIPIDSSAVSTLNEQMGFVLVGSNGLNIELSSLEGERGIVLYVTYADVGGDGPQGEKGDQGDKGDPGATGPKGDSGEVGAQGPAGDGLNWKGTWNDSTTYAPNDVVEFNGSSYVALDSTMDSANTTKWQLIAMKGSLGDSGAVGPQGTAGPPGDTGATGPQGPKGDKGDKGDQGLSMDSSFFATTGELVIKRSDGSFDTVSTSIIQGPQGVKGDKGDKGDTGGQGIQGIQGVIGPTGNKGDKGDKGDAGTTGLTGKRGPKGTAGNWKGEWNAATSYTQDDLVFYNKSYFAIDTTSVNDSIQDSLEILSSAFLDSLMDSLTIPNRDSLLDSMTYAEIISELTRLTFMDSINLTDANYTGVIPDTSAAIWDLLFESDRIVAKSPVSLSSNSTGYIDSIGLNPGSNAHDLMTWDGNNWISRRLSTTLANLSIDNRQPWIGIYHVIALQGVFPSRNGLSNPTIGEVTMFAGNFPPRTWALCDGQLLAIAQNTALFSILGTTFGGDGRTTFALPDLRGRVPIHPGTGPGLSPYSWGQKGGNEKVQ